MRERRTSFPESPWRVLRDRGGSDAVFLRKILTPGAVGREIPVELPTVGLPSPFLRRFWFPSPFLRKSGALPIIYGTFKPQVVLGMGRFLHRRRYWRSRMWHSTFIPIKRRPRKSERFDSADSAHDHSVLRMRAFPKPTLSRSSQDRVDVWIKWWLVKNCARGRPDAACHGRQPRGDGINQAAIKALPFCGTLH